MSNITPAFTEKPSLVEFVREEGIDFLIIAAALGKFTINDSSIFGKNNVTLTSTDYVMAFTTDNAFAVRELENDEATWNYNKNKGTADLVAGQTEGWAFKVNNKGKTNETIDYKTIVYTKAKPVTLATVSGLKKNLEADAEGNIYGLSFGFTEKSSNVTGSNADATATSYVGTVIIGESVLDNKTVTVATAKAKKSTYEFVLSPDNVHTPEDGDRYWTADGNGKVFYKYDTTDGYTLNTTGTTLTYAKAATTNLATISGLVKTTANGKTKVEKTDENLATFPDIAVQEGKDFSSEETTNAKGQKVVTVNEKGVIELSNADILTNKVTISSNYYILAPAENIDADEISAPKWYFSGGTATYREYTTEGYAANAKGTTVEFKKEVPGKTHLTLKGLVKKDSDNKDITVERINNENLIKVSGTEVTIDKKITGTSTITLANGVEIAKTKTAPAVYYNYEIAGGTYTTRNTLAPKWYFKNGTATLKQTTTAGFELGALSETNGQQKLTYSKEVEPTIATVKNLATNLAVATADDVTKATAAGRDDITAGEIYITTTTGTGKSAVTTVTGTAPVLSYDADAKIITVNPDALTKKNATLTSDATKYGYKFALGGDVVKTAVNATEWVVNGTSASYKNYDKAFYTLSDEKTIKYTADTTGTTYAIVTGLKAADANTTDLNNVYTAAAAKDPTQGGILKLDKTHLGTSTIKVTTNLKNTNNVDGFVLAVDTGSESDNKVDSLMSELKAGSWKNTNGTATLSGTLGVGFTQEFGGKTLTYNKTANKSVTIAKITGLKANASVSSNSEGVVTLKDTDLNKKNVAITTSMGSIDYKLSIDADLAPEKAIVNDVAAGEGTAEAPSNPAKKTPGWTISGSTGTLKGYVVNEGYTLAASGKSITYTGATATTTNNKTKEVSYKDTTTLATIKGLKTTADKSLLINSGVISLTSSNTNGDLTINAGTYGVTVDATYKNKKITGSAATDNIVVAGTGVSVTGGKGDDSIDLGTGKNTFVYSNGDGNDVIANFKASDKLQINSGAVAVAASDSDVVVKVGTGSITLTGFSGKTIDIYNSKGVATTYAVDGRDRSSSDLFIDDNYSTDAAQLSSLVKADLKNYTPYDFSSNFSLTKEKEEFTPQISYSGTNKK